MASLLLIVVLISHIDGCIQNIITTRIQIPEGSNAANLLETWIPNASIWTWTTIDDRPNTARRVRGIHVVSARDRITGWRWGCYSTKGWTIGPICMHEKRKIMIINWAEYLEFRLFFYLLLKMLHMRNLYILKIKWLLQSVSRRHSHSIYLLYSLFGDAIIYRSHSHHYCALEEAVYWRCSSHFPGSAARARHCSPNRNHHWYRWLMAVGWLFSMAVQRLVVVLDAWSSLRGIPGDVG